jgi:hypothetical protein
MRRACRAPPPATGSRRKPIREVAQTDLGTEFRRQPRQPVRSFPRPAAAGDPHDDERIVGETVPVIHIGVFAICSMSQARAEVVASPNAALALCRSPASASGGVLLGMLTIRERGRPHSGGSWGRSRRNRRRRRRRPGAGNGGGGRGLGRLSGLPMLWRRMAVLGLRSDPGGYFIGRGVILGAGRFLARGEIFLCGGGGGGRGEMDPPPGRITTSPHSLARRDARALWRR